MRRTVADSIAFAIMWTPVLAILVFAAWALASGVAHLEANTYGSEYIIEQGDENPLDQDLKDHMAMKQAYGLD